MNQLDSEFLGAMEVSLDASIRHADRIWRKRSPRQARLVAQSVMQTIDMMQRPSELQYIYDDAWDLCLAVDAWELKNLTPAPSSDCDGDCSFCSSFSEA